MGKMFKSSEKSSPGVSVAADPYRDVRGSLNTYLKGEIGQTGKKYTGETVAPMTSQEQRSLDYLDQYTGSGAAATTTAARQMALDTLKGEKDPTKSPVYQAVKAEAMRNLGKEQDYIKDQAAGGGRYYTGARLAEQGNAATDVNIALNKDLALAAENERDRQIGMVPVAAALGEAETNEPLNKAAANQQLGALPRVLEQAVLDTKLQDWLRSEYDYPLNIAQIAAGVQQAPLYTQNYMKPGWFTSIMEGLKPASMMGVN